VDEVIEYLRGLMGTQRENAKRYIERTPSQIDTEYRGGLNEYQAPAAGGPRSLLLPARRPVAPPLRRRVVRRRGRETST